MMKKEKIYTEEAPKAIGIYSQAIKTSGNLVFISGQIPLDPNTMQLVDGDFTQQAEQVFKNLKAICESAGGSLNNIVKLSIFLTDLKQFDIVNRVCAEYFQEPYPARAVVEVSALPKGAQLEAEAVMSVL